jgi:hypothetical protein
MIFVFDFKDREKGRKAERLKGGRVEEVKKMVCRLKYANCPWL